MSNYAIRTEKPRQDLRLRPQSAVRAVDGLSLNVPEGSIYWPCSYRNRRRQDDDDSQDCAAVVWRDHPLAPPKSLD